MAKLNRSAHYRKKRLSLAIAQGGRCWWCKRPVREIKWVGRKGERVPTDMATLDHVIDKFDPRRLAPLADGEKRHVLACWGCNQRRCAERNREFIGAQDLRQR